MSARNDKIRQSDSPVNVPRTPDAQTGSVNVTIRAGV